MRLDAHLVIYSGKSGWRFARRALYTAERTCSGGESCRRRGLKGVEVSGKRFFRRKGGEERNQMLIYIYKKHLKWGALITLVLESIFRFPKQGAAVAFSFCDCLLFIVIIQTEQAGYGVLNKSSDSFRCSFSFIQECNMFFLATQ